MIVSLWLFWALVFFGLALLLASRALRQNKNEVNEDHDSRWYDYASLSGADVDPGALILSITDNSQDVLNEPLLSSQDKDGDQSVLL